ncbi:MAG TPA: hypothetical protein VHF22_11920 [Planctomycetota bacterium]|nr:hypothetical protein [Planctomycetota bacterium]
MRVTHLAAIAGLILSTLGAGCASSIEYKKFGDAERRDLATKDVEVGNGGGQYAFSKIYTGKNELKKIGILHIEGPFAEVNEALTQSLKEQGFEVVPWAEVKKAPSLKDKDLSFGGFGANWTLVQDDEWGSNLQRETGCDAFVMARAWEQGGRRIFIFFPVDAHGYKAEVRVLVPYNKYKLACNDTGTHAIPNAMNQNVNFYTKDPIDAGSTDSLTAARLTTDLCIRGLRLYYPKPL